MVMTSPIAMALFVEELPPHRDPKASEMVLSNSSLEPNKASKAPESPRAGPAPLHDLDPDPDLDPQRGHRSIHAPTISLNLPRTSNATSSGRAPPASISSSAPERRPIVS